MFPVSIMKNCIEGVGVNAELFSEHRAVTFYARRPSNVFGKKQPNPILREDCPVMTISFQLPSFQNHVGFVGVVIPEEEVVGVDTVSNITPVKNPHSGGNRPIVNNPRGPVRSHEYIFNAAPKDTIPLGIFASGP